MSCKTCFKKVEAEDNKFNCSLCKSSYSHAYRRYKFIVNIVDDTSNTSLLVWDREGIQLIGKKVYEFVGDDNQVLPMEDIAKEIEKKLVGQSMLFKLQFRNQLEYYRSYPKIIRAKIVKKCLCEIKLLDFYSKSRFQSPTSFSNDIASQLDVSIEEVKDICKDKISEIPSGSIEEVKDM
ncbi:uncharacterized protein LOC121801131 [Salvia splendens]|uniref:uncharacterized protein LOC121801131 n=1 Tax=Salvia splendens TaxID=180675 RepID=UPI001C281311|nr:uncharacterized protein LOC121801131 [Salvia splendens]